MDYLIKRYFNINDILTPATKDKIFKECNENLKSMVLEMIKMNNVK